MDDLSGIDKISVIWMQLENRRVSLIVANLIFRAKGVEVFIRWETRLIFFCWGVIRSVAISWWRSYSLLMTESWKFQRTNIFTMFEDPFIFYVVLDRSTYFGGVTTDSTVFISASYSNIPERTTVNIINDLWGVSNKVTSFLFF